MLQKIGVIITFWTVGSDHLASRTLVGLRSTFNHFIFCGIDVLSWLIGLVGKADQTCSIIAYIHSF